MDSLKSVVIYLLGIASGVALSLGFLSESSERRRPSNAGSLSKPLHPDSQAGSGSSLTGLKPGTDSSSVETNDGHYTIPAHLAQHFQLTSVDTNFVVSREFAEEFGLSDAVIDSLQATVESVREDLTQFEKTHIRVLDASNPSRVYFHIPANPNSSGLREKFEADVRSLLPEFAAQAFLNGAKRSLILQTGNLGEMGRIARVFPNGEIYATDEELAEGDLGGYILESAFRVTDVAVPDSPADTGALYLQWKESASWLSSVYFTEIPENLSHIISPTED